MFPAAAVRFVISSVLPCLEVCSNGVCKTVMGIITRLGAIFRKQEIRTGFTAILAKKILRPIRIIKI